MGETTLRIEEAEKEKQEALEYREAEDARRKQKEEAELRRIEREKQIIADATAAFEKDQENKQKEAEWRQKNDCGHKDWRDKEYDPNGAVNNFQHLHWKHRMKNEAWGKQYENMVEHWE